jgi:hypothetical protein
MALGTAPSVGVPGYELGLVRLFGTTAKIMVQM